MNIFPYLTKHIFGIEFIIFCLDLKDNVVINQQSMINNSYTPFITWNWKVKFDAQGKLQQGSKKQTSQNALLFL